MRILIKSLMLVILSAVFVYAANVKVSELPAVVSPGNSDTFPVTQGGVTKKETLLQIKTFIESDLTKSSVGLGNVDNTSDLNKPISLATQTALDAHSALTGTNAHGLGTMSTQNSSNVSITGGTIGASVTVSSLATHTAATGTSVHGLGTMSTQNANNVSITGGSITGATVSGVTVTTVNAITDGTNTLKVKVLDIGDWNMDSTDHVDVAVSPSIPVASVVGITVRILNDTSSTSYPLNILTGSGFGTGDNQPAGYDTFTGSSIRLDRTTQGFFDTVAFDQTSFNRGKIMIWYVE